MSDLPPMRIQRRREKGWRMPDGVVNVTRPSKWGNPFVVGDRITVTGVTSTGELYSGPATLTAETACELYRDLVLSRLVISDSDLPADREYAERWRAALLALRGRDVACWCPTAAAYCHADVLLDLANGPALW